jgi:uncharacterized membrane protein YfcA
MGMDASMANGTNRVGILTQTFSASMSFKKQKFSDFKLSLKLALLTLPGAVLGVFYSFQIDDRTFHIVVIGVIVLVAINILIPSSKKKKYTDKVSHIPIITYPLMFMVGFYIGFIQAGVGFLLIAVLSYTLNLNIKRVNMHKVFIIFFNAVPILFVFIYTNNIDWVAGIVLSAGTSIGAWWSARLSLVMDEKYVKLILFIAMIVMAIQLLGNI